MTRLLALAVALVFAAVLSAGADEDDCQSVMAMLAAAQRDAQDQMDFNNALEDAIAAPSFDPVADAWMVDNLNWGIADLLGFLNEAAVYAERAHEAHCY